MSIQNHQNHCCPPSSEDIQSGDSSNYSRRQFVAMGGVLMGGLTLHALNSTVFAGENGANNALNSLLMPKPRVPLVVKPVLVYDLPTRREQASWRNWGDIHSEEAAREEVSQIRSELDSIKTKADYPVEFLDIAAVTNIDQMNGQVDMQRCDTILVYGAGYHINGVQNFGKDVILFQRWKSGAVYLQYEIVSPRFLRQHTDREGIPGISHNDVVTDNLEDLNWRFRALCGLKNTIGSKIITIGGAGAWSQGNRTQALLDKVKDTWKFQYHDVSHQEITRLVNDARADRTIMAKAQRRAEDYLKIPSTKLETTQEFFVNCFVLDEIFRMLMKNIDTNLITVNSCMGAIMHSSKTTACLTLTTLNDDGYLAFCESDFVVIPSGVLLGNITGKPVFFCNPTYPHDNVATIAHCTAPRKMDGKTFDPVRIVTHFESDYGAAPWVRAPIGTEITSIIPAFNADRWVGFKAKIIDVPFRPICRTQFDIKYDIADRLLEENLIGFHWMTCYGDYRKELGYALRRTGIAWDNLDEV